MDNTKDFLEIFHSMEIADKIKTIFDMLDNKNPYEYLFTNANLPALIKVEENRILLICCQKANKLNTPNTLVDFSVIAAEAERLYYANPYIMGKLREKIIDEILGD